MTSDLKVAQTYRLSRDDGGATQALERDKNVGPTPQLPLVSAIIVNFNYGRFLEDAVHSVYGQTYGRVECIVVDNASTDSTPEIIAALSQRYPDLVTIRRAQNDGQTPASLDGLARCTGQYVIFMDADDYLLPHCIETHVYAHLSMRKHVGFTSGDMLQLRNDEVVLSTSEEVNRFICSGRGLRPKVARAFRSTPHWPSAAVRTAVDGRLHYVRPLKAHWIWSPTSGICYRRDALRLFEDNPGLSRLRTGTDLYFAMGCSGLSGSVIIDEPLFAYRIHGGNIYSHHPQLDRTLNFMLGGKGDSNSHAQLLLVDHLVARVERFALNLLLRLNFLALLVIVDCADHSVGLPRWARRSRAAQALARNYDHVVRTLGASLARLMLIAFSGTLRRAETLVGELPR